MNIHKFIIMHIALNPFKQKGWRKNWQGRQGNQKFWK